MELRANSPHISLVSLLFTAAFLAAGDRSLAQVSGTGPACRFEFGSQATANGTITTTYTRVDGKKQSAPIGVTTMTTTAEMAGSMCVATRSSTAPGLPAGSLSCTVTGAALNGCCVIRSSSATARISKWSIVCVSETGSSMGVVINNLGGAASCPIPIRPGGGGPAQQLELLPPILEFSGTPLEAAEILVQTPGGDLVTVSVDAGSPLDEIGSRVLEGLANGGYVAENMGIGNSLAGGNRQAVFIELRDAPNGMPVEEITTLVYRTIRPGGNADPSIGYGALFGTKDGVVPALSTWGLIAMGLVLAILGAVLLRRRRTMLPQHG